MRFEWDELKNQANIRKRNLDFADATEMFDHPMLIELDRRTAYPEARSIGFGFIQKRLMVVVYTERGQDIIRIISFRKGNKREQSLFEQKIKNRLGQG
jgi:uncharacterized DUF497 family protein